MDCVLTISLRTLCFSSVRFSCSVLSDSLWTCSLPCTVVHQVPLSMGFSMQEYWSGLPFPTPGDLANPGIERRSPAWQVDALSSEPPGKPQQREEQVLS